MNVREWALIAFSILAQMSVGAFLVLGALHFLAQRQAGVDQADQLSDRALLAIGPILVLGMIASLFHLGTPLTAYKAIANWQSSWLSREILFGVLFASTGALFALMQWRKLASFPLRSAVALLAALFGVGLVYSMSQVYLLPTVPAWNSPATPIAFFITTFLLGTLAMGAALVANYAFIQRQNPGCASQQCILLRDSLRWIAVAALVLLGLQFVVLPLQLAALASSASPAAAASAARLVNELGLVLALRFLLVFLGAGLIAVFIYQNASSPGRERILGYLTYAAFALVFVAEVLGRFLFYSSYARIGL